MSTCPVTTIRVKRDGPKGYKTINLSDYDPTVHKLWEPSAEHAALDLPAPVPVPTPNLRKRK